MQGGYEGWCFGVRGGREGGFQEEHTYPLHNEGLLGSKAAS